ncbi:MAG: hypothetical protein EOL97_14345 [Spirochaetia bacterium]|nr:hypothetical protein [Spirochaetia bacterium]
MNIIKVEKSFELCAESGWYGYDIYFDEKIDKKLILSLNSFGHLLYLSKLKVPFFKVETSQYIIKGTEGKNNLRIGIFNNNQKYLNYIIENILNNL